MSSVLTSIKQVPVTGGKFVCILAGANNAYPVTNLTDRVPSNTTATTTIAVGTELIDLGVTYVARPAANSSMSIVYRKVVSVVEAQSSAPVPRFIRTVDPAGTVYFARTA